MGCDFYENVTLEFEYSVQDKRYKASIKDYCEKHWAWFDYEDDEDGNGKCKYDQLLGEQMDKIEQLTKNVPPNEKVKNYIKKSHNFDYGEDDVSPFSDADVDTYVHLQEFIFGSNAYPNKQHVIYQIKNRLQTTRINANFNKDVIIHSVTEVHSCELRE